MHADCFVMPCRPQLHRQAQAHPQQHQQQRGQSGRAGQRQQRHQPLQLRVRLQGYRQRSRAVQCRELDQPGLQCSDHDQQQHGQQQHARQQPRLARLHLPARREIQPPGPRWRTHPAAARSPPIHHQAQSDREPSPPAAGNPVRVVHVTGCQCHQQQAGPDLHRQQRTRHQNHSSPRQQPDYTNQKHRRAGHQRTRHRVVGLDATIGQQCTQMTGQRLRHATHGRHQFQQQRAAEHTGGCPAPARTQHSLQAIDSRQLLVEGVQAIQQWHRTQCGQQQAQHDGRPSLGRRVLADQRDHIAPSSSVSATTARYSMPGRASPMPSGLLPHPSQAPLISVQARSTAGWQPAPKGDIRILAVHAAM